jgi:hypothetical protein
MISSSRFGSVWFDSLRFASGSGQCFDVVVGAAVVGVVLLRRCVGMNFMRAARVVPPRQRIFLVWSELPAMCGEHDHVVVADARRVTHWRHAGSIATGETSAAASTAIRPDLKGLFFRVRCTFF